MEKTSQVELFGGTELGTVEKSSSIKGTVNTGIESFFWPGTERFEKFRLSWNCKTPVCWCTLHAAFVQDRLVFALGVDTFSWEGSRGKTPFMAAIDFYAYWIHTVMLRGNWKKVSL